MLLFGGSEISERITELIKKWKTFSRIQVRNLCACLEFLVDPIQFKQNVNIAKNNFESKKIKNQRNLKLSCDNNVLFKDNFKNIR